MKKFMTLLLALAMVLSLAACTTGENSDPSGTPSGDPAASGEPAPRRAGPPADRRAGGAGPGTPTSADEKSASGGAVFPSLRDLLDTMRLTVAGGGGSLSPYPSKFGC